MNLVTLLLPVLAGAMIIQDAYHLEELTFTDSAVATFSEISLKACMARCSRPSVHAQYCDGVRYSDDGGCDLMAHPHHCLKTRPFEAGDNSSFSRHAFTTLVTYCPSDWIAFDGSCYLRTSSRISRGAANSACKHNSCSSPVSTNTDLEMHFILHHSSRSSYEEWLGIKTDNVNPDGTRYVPFLSTSQVQPGSCVSLRSSQRSDSLIATNCGAPKRYICEMRMPAGLLNGCPPNWLQTPTHCFSFIGGAPGLKFAMADQICAIAFMGRLGFPTEAGMEFILAAYVKAHGHSGSFWVGVSDQASETDWVTVDSSSYHLKWPSSNPQNSHDTVANCARMSAETAEADTGPCQDTLPFVCIKPRVVP